MGRKRRRARIISTGLRTGPKRTGVLQKRPKLMLLTGVMLCGLLLGALALRYADASQQTILSSIFDNELHSDAAEPIWKNFLYSFATQALYLLIAFIAGLCLAGEPVLWLLPLLKGMGTGLISAYLYKTYAVNGMLYFSAVLLVPSVLFAASFLLCCNESILMTRDLNRMVLKNEHTAAGGEMLRLYFLRYAVLLLSLVFAAALGAVLQTFIGGKVELTI